MATPWLSLGMVSTGIVQLSNAHTAAAACANGTFLVFQACRPNIYFYYI